ncbi:unnamed protein product, partial [Phaeothamnion confervicola]
GSGVGGGAAGLTPMVQARLQALYTSGFCQPQEIDDRCLSLLAELPEGAAMQALDEFHESNRSSIRNPAAYLMGVMRKHSLGGTSSTVGGGGEWGGKRG